MNHIERLRKQCEPVQEDTPIPEREHRVIVDRRDLLKLLGDAQVLLDHNEALWRKAWGHK